MSDRQLRGLNLINNGGGCGCGGHGAADASEVDSAPVGGVSTDFFVQGMTCAHCVRSVTEELCAVDGVQSVHVDLLPGSVSRVQVASVAPLDVERVREAVDEAGYSLVQP